MKGRVDRTSRRALVTSGIWPTNRLVVLLALLLVAAVAELAAAPVAVQYTEGLVHGFLTLKTLDGRAIADGDLSQVATGAQVKSRLTFRFRDGSMHEETAVYTQRGHFRLVSYRLVQRGASFPRSLEMTIDAASGMVTVRHTDEEGDAKTESERMELPPDLANGLMSTLLKSVQSGPPPTLSYVIKVDVGGISGLIAPLIGKDPPDAHVWILPGVAPAFVKAEQTLYAGGPVWRIELTSPAWPRAKPPADAPRR
jgi:hypothetical protein